MDLVRCITPRPSATGRPSPIAARGAGVAGFTLVEMIVVIVVAGMLGVVAVGSIGGMVRGRQAAAALGVQRDLCYARERAMTTGLRHWVAFAPTTDSYSVLIEPADGTGYASAGTLLDAGTGVGFVVRFADGPFEGADLESASFDGAAVIGFDRMGRPLSVTGDPLAGEGLVSISGGHTVTVAPGNGSVHHAGP